MGRSLRWMIGTAVVANVLSIAAAQPVQVRGVVLDNVRIIDGSGAAPIESGRIVIERARIARIGRATEIPVPAGAETVDLSGRTVIPGLIDLHFHIENDPKLAELSPRTFWSFAREFSSLRGMGAMRERRRSGT